MTNKNYKKGADYERRFCKERLKDGAVISKRFYASRGITDVYWVDKVGKYSEAQLKYSDTKPKISKLELGRLVAYAQLNPFPVHLVMKTRRRPAKWERLN